MPVKDAVIKSNVTTVSARKKLEKQVALMLEKRFGTVRYAGGIEGGLIKKTQACGHVYAENCTDIKKGLRKPKSVQYLKKLHVFQQVLMKDPQNLNAILTDVARTRMMRHAQHEV